MTWLAIKLFMGGALKRLWGALGSLFRLIGRYPLQAALIASLCLSGWLWRGNVSKDRRIVYMTAEHAKQIAKFETASAANLAAAKKQVAETEARYTAQAMENARAENALRAALGARSNANADRMRFDRLCGRDTAPAPADHPAPEPDGPGADAIVVERRDYDTLVENTVRLQAAHDWAKGLITEGLARPVVPEVGFGQ